MAEFQEHPDQQLEQYIVYFLTKAQHPNLFLILASTLIIYISWRLLCNMYVIFKRLLFISFLIFVIFLFLRGFDQVIFGDLPLLYKLVRQNKDFEIVLTRWTTYLSKTSRDHSTAAVNLLFAKLREVL